MNDFFTDSILPPAPEGLQVLHDREYRVQAYRKSADRVLIHGAVRDQKPPHLYLADDPEPLPIHHMQVELEIAFPDLEIVDVGVGFETHPNETCPSIIDHYDHLVGLSIARGFTHRIRELFGGPRGCTHTTALLQAMAPVAMQCFWSMSAAEAKENGRHPNLFDGDRREVNDSWKRIVNTCHVWDENGQAFRDRSTGSPEKVPVFIRDRLAKLGIDGSGGPIS